MFSPKSMTKLEDLMVFDEFQHPAIQTKIEQHFGGFFHQIKVCQPV
jgi:hypothetical protein